MELKNYIREILDFPKPGINFKDITPLLADPDAFEYAVSRIGAHYAKTDIGAIAAAEARGFLFAAPLALQLRKPLIPLRKPGKLPFSTHSQKYELEYGNAELQMHTDSVTPGKSVLLVDDLLATGGTVAAACKLVEQAGGTVAGCAFVVELDFLNGRDKLNGYEIFSLIRY